MDKKTKVKMRQRIVGALVLLAILAIFLPLLFHRSRPSTELKISTKIPSPPKAPQVELQLPQPQKLAVKKEALPPRPEPEPEPVPQPKPVPEPRPKPQPQPAPPPQVKSTKSKKKMVKKSAKKALLNPIVVPKAWVVQLGSFSQSANAKKLVTKLRQQNFDAYSRTITLKSGKKITRVYVGPEIHREQIQKLAQKLKQKFHLKGIVRRYKV